MHKIEDARLGQIVRNQIGALPKVYGSAAQERGSDISDLVPALLLEGVRLGIMEFFFRMNDRVLHVTDYGTFQLIWISQEEIPQEQVDEMQRILKRKRIIEGRPANKVDSVEKEKLEAEWLDFKNKLNQLPATYHLWTNSLKIFPEDYENLSYR